MVFVQEADDLLCFGEVRHVSHGVRSSRDEPEASSGLVSARDDDEIDGFLVDVHDALLDEPADEGLKQVSKARFLELGHVSLIVDKAIVMIGDLEGILDCVSEGPGDVVGRREVEALRGEDLLKHVDVDLVRDHYLILSWIFEAERHEHEFGGSIHVAVHDIGGELGLGDNDQVSLHLQLDEAVDREGQVGVFLHTWSADATILSSFRRHAHNILSIVGSESQFTHMQTVMFFSSSRTSTVWLSGNVSTRFFAVKCINYYLDESPD